MTSDSLSSVRQVITLIDRWFDQPFAMTLYRLFALGCVYSYLTMYYGGDSVGVTVQNALFLIVGAILLFTAELRGLRTDRYEEQLADT